MLTFKTLFLFTVLLIIPVLIALRCNLRRRDSVFLQMMFGYTGCYFMKNFYAFLNRAVNGVENDRLGMDWVAMLATVSFLIATWFCLCHLSGEDKKQMDIFKRKLQLFLLVEVIAVLVENFAGAIGNQILFIICYLVSVTCIYAVTIITWTWLKDAGNFQVNKK